MNKHLYLLATDVQIQELSENHIYVKTNNKKYELRGEEIFTLFGKIIPKLDGRKAIEDLFKGNDLTLLLNNLEQLIKLGIILEVDYETSNYLVNKSTQMDYTYFKRTHSDGNQVFKKAKNSIHYYTNLDIVKEVIKNSSLLNFTYISDWKSEFYMDFFVAVVSETRKELLYEMQLWCIERNIKFCPILIDTKKQVAQIGPFYYPKETACLYCLPSNKLFKQNKDDYFMGLLTTSDIQFILSFFSFFYYQYLDNRKEHTPWSKFITINLNSGEQKISNVYKVPFCTKCNELKYQPDSWELV